MVYLPYSTQQMRFKSILPLLQNDSDSKPEILLHMFSNAGAHQACQLARSYQAHNQTSLKVSAMILGSTPGVATYARITDAMIIGLPSIPILHQLLTCLVYGLVGLIWLQSSISGRVNLVEKARRDLNNSKLVGSKRGKLYLYSIADKMVGWEDVESHAMEAEKMGEHVERERDGWRLGMWGICLMMGSGIGVL